MSTSAYPPASSYILPVEVTGSLEGLPPSDVVLNCLAGIYKHPARIYHCMMKGIKLPERLSEIDSLEDFDTSHL